MKQRFALFFIIILSITILLCACNKPVTPGDSTDYEKIEITSAQALEKLNDLAGTDGFRIETRFNGNVSVYAKRGSFTLFDKTAYLKYGDEYKVYTFSNGSWFYDKKITTEEFDSISSSFVEGFFVNLFTAQSLNKLVSVSKTATVNVYGENTTGETAADFLKDKNITLTVDNEYGLTLNIASGDTALFSASFEKNYSVPTLPFDPVPSDKQTPDYIKGVSALDKLTGNFALTLSQMQNGYMIQRTIRVVGNDVYIASGDIVKVFFKKENGYLMYVFNKNTPEEYTAYPSTKAELDAETDVFFDPDGTKEYSLSTWLQLSSDYIDSTTYNAFHTAYASSYKGEDQTIAGVECGSAIVENLSLQKEFVFDKTNGVLFKYTVTQDGVSMVKYQVLSFASDVTELGFAEPEPEKDPEPDPEPVIPDVALEQINANANELFSGYLYAKIVSGEDVKELYYFKNDDVIESGVSENGQFTFYVLESDYYKIITGTAADHQTVKDTDYANWGEESKSFLLEAASADRAGFIKDFKDLATEYLDEDGNVKEGFSKTTSEGFTVYSSTVENVTTSYFVNDKGFAVKRATGDIVDYQITIDTDYRYPFE